MLIILRIFFIFISVAEIGSKNKTLANKIPTNNTKTGRILTSQEESILLPLIQGLIAAGGGSSSENAESSAKRKNSIEHEKSVSRRSSGSKASQSDVLANNELNTKGLFFSKLKCNYSFLLGH